MSLVSPLSRPKPTTSMPSGLGTLNHDQPTENLNEYTVFLLLERMRIKKLKDVYGNTITTLKKDEQSQEGDALPKFPARYQCLNGLSARWLIIEIGKRRSRISISSSKEEFRGLDRATKAFLEDVVHILKDRYHSQTRRSTVISPPPSPLTLPLTATEETALSSPERYLIDTEKRSREIDDTRSRNER